MYFCYRAKKKGVEIWCDTDVFSSHVGFAPTITRGHTELCEKREEEGHDPGKGVPVSYLRQDPGPMDPAAVQDLPKVRRSAVDTRSATSLA